MLCSFLHNVNKTSAPCLKTGYPLRKNIHKTAKHVSSCLQLAILLEVSAHKPGNVNRTASFQSTRYEHFLASAVAVEPSFAHAAERGIMVSDGKIQLNELGVGEIIKDAVVNANAWQHGGNTLLGTVLLLSPIAAATGMTLAEGEEFSISKLRGNIKLVVESTTPSDAVAVYEAINIASPSGLVDKAPTLDVNDPSSKKKILEESVTLYEVFKISAPYDSISREWVENYPITFKKTYRVRRVPQITAINPKIIPIIREAR